MSINYRWKGRRSGAYEIKGDSKLRATLNIPGHTVDELLWGNTAAETILMCTDAFDVFLATGDWKKAYLVVEDYIGF